MTRNYFYDDNVIKMYISCISEDVIFIKQPYSWDLQVEVKTTCIYAQNGDSVIEFSVQSLK